MYNMLKRTLSVLIACTVLLGSMPLQAQLPQQTLPNNQMDRKMVEILYANLPDVLREKAFLKKNNILVEGDEMIVLRNNYRVRVPSQYDPRQSCTVYIQEIAPDYIAPDQAKALRSYSMDMQTNRLLTEAYPTNETFRTLYGYGWFMKEVDLYPFRGYSKNLIKVMYNTTDIKKMTADLHHLGLFVNTDAQHEILDVYTSKNPLFQVTADEKILFGQEVIVKTGGVEVANVSKIHGSWRYNGMKVAPVQEYYKANLSTIKKLVASVEMSIQKRFPKYQGVFFKKFLQNDVQYMANKLERTFVKQAAAKKAGKQAGKTVLRSMGGAFFGIGVYAALTAATVTPIQAANVQVTPRHELIKQSAADMKDIQLKSEVEKLALFADPNNMPLIVKDAKLLQEMGKYQALLDESGLTVEQAADIIVNEMFAPIIQQEQTKQAIIKKVKHI